MSFRYNGRGVREISFESLARPLMALQDKQEKYEDSISLLNSEAAKYELLLILNLIQKLLLYIKE